MQFGERARPFVQSRSSYPRPRALRLGNDHRITEKPRLPSALFRLQLPTAAVTIFPYPIRHNNPQLADISPWLHAQEVGARNRVLKNSAAICYPFRDKPSVPHPDLVPGQLVSVYYQEPGMEASSKSCAKASTRPVTVQAINPFNCRQELTPKYHAKPPRLEDRGWDSFPGWTIVGTVPTHVFNSSALADDLEGTEGRRKMQWAFLSGP
ncbi:hypothetical protein FHL15_008104 [Xylaria flabelliformis]|uniref:Uncharacterized protein n=1 Tax=Xylaria flabelliformis TaxID=2512241 RepID=A0A553HSG4_9PEZI|nr:hypothetical protein FHL15_008104 [Xylaria flabelliformis]